VTFPVTSLTVARSGVERHTDVAVTVLVGLSISNDCEHFIHDDACVEPHRCDAKFVARFVRVPSFANITHLDPSAPAPDT